MHSVDIHVVLQPTLASSGATARPLPLPLPLWDALVSWVLVMAGLRFTTAGRVEGGGGVSGGTADSRG